MMKRFYLFMFPCFLGFSTGAFSQTTFVNRAGAHYSDYATSCAEAYDNGIILALETCTNGMDLHSGLVKTDVTGTMQWYKLYQVGDYTIPVTVLPGNDEGYIVLAYASDSSYINNNKHFSVLYKTDNQGNTLWNRQYALSDNDLPLNLVYRKAGGYISFTLGDYNLGTYPKTVVTAYRNDGSVIWSKDYNLNYGLYGVKGSEMPDGRICFTAKCVDPANNFFNDVVVTMLDSTGNILWAKSAGTYYDDNPNSIAVNSSGNIFITGNSYFITRNWDSFLLRFDGSGNITGSRVYDGGTTEGEVMRCILAFNDGSCRLLGDMGTFDERDFIMMNIDSGLSVSLSHRYPFSPQFTNYPFDFMRMKDGGLVFTGDYRPPVTTRDAIIAKTENDGSLPCFSNITVINEFNENYSDVPAAVTVQQTHVFPLNFPANIPVNPFTSHVVCPLATSVEEAGDQFGIFPNPCSDLLNISMLHGSTTDISILDACGKIVFHKKMEGVSCTVSLRELSSGLYFVRLTDGENSVIKKVVRQ